MMETLPIWIAVPVALLLVISGILTLTGSLGLLRLPTFYSRIHAPTLGNTLGVFCVLVASILVSSTLEHRAVVHQILITVFLVITSPVTAMLLMRAAIKRKAREEERLAQEGAIADLPGDPPGKQTENEGLT
ncbi:monovalent cation/H(+) antiporter subunit G [Pusillimonas sp. SM2304]|uniref:monovalent cation/H(+) antiporter subunit G n=1 Tax=Pusillimonas sp. SM2304 TaxID=3073241 RepID=UPI00287703C9|nr:monovalent cation/H(+) antiporter subunit G [Pusillimonas sp. SM2304]MDS1141211.1 monovalent cation/H(+) antiporter subunit G [Pusillimonas sp. SM2304]